MSLATDLQAIQTKTGTLETDLEDIKNALTEKGVADTDNIKISDVDEKILEISGSGGQPYAGSGQELYYGITFPNEYPTHIIFTDQEAPQGTKVVDWSNDGKKGVVKWLDNTTDTLYVSTQMKGLKIIFPSDCSYMFQGKDNSGYIKTNKQTVSIEFNNMVDTSNVTNMENMFRRCQVLESIDISSFDTSSVTSFAYVFSNCIAVTSINLTGLDLSNVTSFVSTFSNCSVVEKIILDDVKFSNSITHTTEMFKLDKNLKEIDLSNLAVTSSLKYPNNMFDGCSELTTIYAQRWTSTMSSQAQNVTIFDNCSKLPNYNSSYKNASMAYWKNSGGYFTNPGDKHNNFKYIENFSITGNYSYIIDGPRYFAYSTAGENYLSDTLKFTPKEDNVGILILDTLETIDGKTALTITPSISTGSQVKLTKGTEYSIKFNNVHRGNFLIAFSEYDSRGDSFINPLNTDCFIFDIRA